MRVVNKADGKVDLIGLEIWGAGKHRGYGSPPGGDNFDTETLDSMVQAHSEIGGRMRPRMYFGHPLNPLLKMLARPKGDVTNLRREGNKLIADVVNTDEAFADQIIKDDARLSPDMAVNHLDPVNGKTYPWVITGVAALGAVQPGNTALQSMAQQFQRGILNPETHYAFAAETRAYAAGEVRTFVYAPLVYPAHTDAWLSLQRRQEFRAFALGEGQRAGLTASMRKRYNSGATDGKQHNLKPGVMGAADTTEKQRRKGSFLSRAGGQAGPLTKPNGDPTPKAMQFRAWGEAVPTSAAAVAKLRAKGKSLLASAQRSKSGS